MNCRGLILELSSYLDGELDAAVVAEIKVHLDRCEDCRIIVDTTKQTIGLYCNCQPVALPEDVRKRLHEGLLKRLGQKPSP